jgi:hypothetical protein
MPGQQCPDPGLRGEQQFSKFGLAHMDFIAHVLEGGQLMDQLQQRRQFMSLDGAHFTRGSVVVSSHGADIVRAT